MMNLMTLNKDTSTGQILKKEPNRLLANTYDSSNYTNFEFLSRQDKLPTDTKSRVDYKAFKLFITQKGSWNYVEKDNAYYVPEYNKEIISETTINRLIDFRYELVKPIKVKIIKGIDEVIGDIEELELYSFGVDEFEVLRQLNEDLTDLFEYLVDMEDNRLGKFPKKWKKILKQYIKK